MKIYDEIKSPIDDDENLKKIVDAYINADGEDSFYMKAVTYGEKDTNFNEDEFNKFKDVIDNLELNKMRKSFEEKIRNGNKLDKEDNKIYNLLKKHNNEEIINFYNKRPKKKGISKMMLTKDEKLIERIMEDRILNKHVYYSLAGFHVRGERLEDYAETQGEFKFKLYLNLDYDQVYKFALEYMKMCRSKNIPYTFKVLSPIKDKPNRSEKMCIYCDKDQFHKVIDIVREIKDNSPWLKPKNPPILAGVLDGWIGIGSDGKNGSYNGIRAGFIERVLCQYFFNEKELSSKKDARNMMNENPKKVLSEIRAKIKDSAELERIVPDKFCFTEIGNKMLKDEDSKQAKKCKVVEYEALEYEDIDDYESDKIAEDEVDKSKVNEIIKAYKEGRKIKFDIEDIEIRNLIKKYNIKIEDIIAYGEALVTYGKNSKQLKNISKAISRRAYNKKVYNKVDNMR